jgi:hypothetical protein
MQPSEFKAWFEGFTAHISGSPATSDWEIIVEKVGSMVTREDSHRELQAQFAARKMEEKIFGSQGLNLGAGGGGLGPYSGTYKP